MEEHDDIEIRSEEVQEIIGTTPGWILRWGSTAALMVLLLLALMSWFIRYPDTIEAPVVVKTTNSAAPVVAPTNAPFECPGLPPTLCDALACSGNPLPFGHGF